METRVRYVVTGVFALLAILATIFFVLWIQNVGSFRARREVLLHFDGPAAGLRAGAPVTFNGVRIGEVTRLSFDPADPSAVIARLSIESDAPISRDTQADIDTQGIVGNIEVALRGGTPEQRLQWRGPNPPVLEGHPTRSLTQEARAALAEMRTVISDNADPLRKVVANVESFSTALARNSDKVDSILGGLEKMTGGGKEAAPRIFDLAVPSLPPLQKSEPMQVAIADPSALVMYDTQKLLVADGKGEISPADLQWSDTTPKLIQRKMAQALDQAGLRYVSAGGGGAGIDAAQPDATVQTEIRAFQIAADPQPHAVITLSLRIAGSDNKILDARVFHAEAPASAKDGPEAAEAMNAAFGQILTEAAPWIAERVARSAKAAPGADAPAADEPEPDAAPSSDGAGKP